MATVNVNRNLTDQFYRYKMPKLLAKVEGKGNGIKTVIVNMVDIAKALNRPPMYPTKYFGCVLGAQVNYDAKNDRYIVNGSHDATNLQNLLDGFIKTYVLCASCHNPETTLLVNQKKGTIGATCKACGHHGSISTQDKLSTYILKFPPDSQKEAGASVSKRKKKDKNDKNRKDGQNNDQHDSDELNGENGVHNNNNNNNDQNDDDGDWCDPKVLGEDPNDIALKKLTLNEDLDKPISQRMQIFYEFAKKKIGDNKIIDKSLQIEIVNEAERLDVRDKAIIAICEILFRDPLKIAETIKTNKNFFLRFTLNNKKCQKYLLRGFEMTVKEFPNELLPRVAVLLKLFYDEDIIDESIIIKWHDKKESSVKGELGNQIFEKAKKLVEWLKTAEEEDDGDDEDDENGGGDRNNNNEDDDEEVEIVYDERIRPDKIIEFEDEKKKNDMMKQASKNDDNDEQNEIDIDAI